MSQIEILAENIKLARLLGVQPDELTYLKALDAGQLRSLRLRLTNSLFDETGASFRRVATASKLLPNGMVALIGEKVFGAMLCARISGLMPPNRAYEIALKLPDAFLAKVSVELDPRSAREVIARMPADRVTAIAAILVERRDYVTMGRFVDYLSRDTIRQVMESIDDDTAILRTAFFVENKAALNDLVRLMPVERIRRLVILAGDERHDLWTEAVGLMSHVNDDWKRRIGDLAAEQDESVLSGLAHAAQRLRLWDSVLPIVGCMSESSQRKLAGLPVLASREVLDRVIAAADANGLWAAMLPLVGYMGADVRRTAAQVFEHLPQDTLQRLIAAAGALQLWPELIGILGDMDQAEQRNVVRLIGEQDEAVLMQLLEAVDRAGLWAAVLPLISLMGPEARKTAARVVPGLPPQVLQQLMDTANQLALWPTLLGILSNLPDTEQRQVAQLISAQPMPLLRGLLEAIHASGLWAELLQLLRHFDDAQLRRLAALLEGRDEQRHALFVAAQQQGPGLNARLADVLGTPAPP